MPILLGQITVFPRLRVGVELICLYQILTVNKKQKRIDESYLGKSFGEAFGYRVAGVTGFDYFVSKALFIGNFRFYQPTIMSTFICFYQFKILTLQRIFRSNIPRLE